MNVNLGKALTLVAVTATLLGAAACSSDESGSDEISLQQKPSNPTHKVVCACTCSGGLDSPVFPSDETHDVPAGGCGKLNGTKCGVGDFNKLKGCEKRSVPAKQIVLERPIPPVKDVKEN